MSAVYNQTAVDVHVNPLPYLQYYVVTIGASEASPYLVFNVAILSVCLYVMD